MVFSTLDQSIISLASTIAMPISDDYLKSTCFTETAQRAQDEPLLYRKTGKVFDEVQPATAEEVDPL